MLTTKTPTSNGISVSKQGSATAILVMDGTSAFLWTWFKGNANSHIESEADDNTAIVPLWSGFASEFGGPLYATDMETHWKVELNLVDVELGRQYWVSKYLTMRPFVGVRFASIKQDYRLKIKGGTWTPVTTGLLPLNDEVRLDNDFRGAGLRSGLDTIWHLGCGWGIYGDFAFNIVYGKFSFDHDETNRQAAGSHLKAKVVDASYSFRASRAMFDLGLGIQWAGMFCDCQYGFLISLGWEHHLFMDQNQMWRVVRIGDSATAVQPNNTGENVFHQRRGDLDTQGVTLRVKFDF